MEPLPHITETVYTHDGERLFLRRACPAPGSPEAFHGALVVLTHGFGEHSTRYGHVIAALVEHGFHVVAYDLRGHGRSTGRRGDAIGFERFLDDLGAIMAQARVHPAFPGGEAARLFLFGHSFGGLITLRYLESRSAPLIAGAVVASPWIRLAFDPPWWKRVLARLAMSICPGMRLVTGMNPQRLSRDQAFLATLPDLHLSHHTLSARLYHEILRTCTRVQAEAGRLDTPLLLLHGQQDPVTSWRASAAFFEHVATRDKTLRLYPDSLHETHNDLDRAAVLNDIIGWLLARGQ